MRVSVILKLCIIGALTHGNNLFMVPITEVIVEGVPPRTWAHFLRTSCRCVYVSPPALRRLAVSASHAPRVVKRVRGLAFVDVGWEVELRDQISPFSAVRVQAPWFRVGRHPSPQIDAPLTTNVVGDIEDKEGGTKKP